MASTSSTVASPEELSPEKATELYARHQRLRAWLRWLLPLGVLPVGALVLLALTYPSRTPLAGYRYQQVGVQAGKTKTWWILAHRAGRAELLLRADTSRSWQRYALDVDSSQAHALALDWGGRALLVGLGTVRMYDAQLRRVGPVHYLDSGRFQGRWVAADATGKWAFIIGDRNRAQQTSDGGKTWTASTISINTFIFSTYTGINSASTPKRGQITERAVVDNKSKTVFWASREGYWPEQYEKLPDGLGYLFMFTPWRRPLRSPIAWLGFDEKGTLLALDQRGTWVSAHEVDSTSNQQASAVAGVAFVPGAAATAVGISATRVVQGAMSKQLAALTSPSAATAPISAADKPTAKLSAKPASAPKKSKPAKQAAAKTPRIRPAKSTEEFNNDRLPSTKRPAAEPQATPTMPATKADNSSPASDQTPTQNPIQQTTGGKPLPLNSPVQQAPQNQAVPRKELAPSTPKTTN